MRFHYDTNEEDSRLHGESRVHLDSIFIKVNSVEHKAIGSKTNANVVLEISCDFAGTELISFVEAQMMLSFGFLMKTVEITH